MAARNDNTAWFNSPVLGALPLKTSIWQELIDKPAPSALPKLIKEKIDSALVTHPDPNNPLTFPVVQSILHDFATEIGGQLESVTHHKFAYGFDVPHSISGRDHVKNLTLMILSLDEIILALFPGLMMTGKPVEMPALPAKPFLNAAETYTQLLGGSDLLTEFIQSVCIYSDLNVCTILILRRALLQRHSFSFLLPQTSLYRFS
jgi:hypothetical protein